MTTLSIAVLFCFFNNAKRGGKKFQEQADHIIQQIGTATFQFPGGWDYAQRGQANFWSRLSGDSSIFSCSFYPSVDPRKLSIYQLDKFLNHFKSRLKVDITYYQFQFAKIGDTALKLVGTNNHAQDILLPKKQSLINKRLDHLAGRRIYTQPSYLLLGISCNCRHLAKLFPLGTIPTLTNDRTNRRQTNN
ncbi:hypothetical protein [Foetidibacter luteolus]|uniref:hypothetical protein n=1 Tax=Foetidibacter luteolus TaxID=2608880 RepID=UPI00129B60C7|nr:hypothetical protein [Foetidibacter luteolus]